MVSCYVVCGADKKIKWCCVPPLALWAGGGEEFEKESGGKGEGRKIEGYMKRVSSYI